MDIMEDMDIMDTVGSGESYMVTYLYQVTVEETRNEDDLFPNPDVDIEYEGSGKDLWMLEGNITVAPSQCYGFFSMPFFLVS